MCFTILAILLCIKSEQTKVLFLSPSSLSCLGYPWLNIYLFAELVFLTHQHLLKLRNHNEKLCSASFVLLLALFLLQFAIQYLTSQKITRCVSLMFTSFCPFLSHFHRDYKPTRTDMFLDNSLLWTHPLSRRCWL